MRGGVEPCPITLLLEDGGHHRSGRPFSVCPSNVDGLDLPVGISDGLQNRFHLGQAENHSEFFKTIEVVE